MRRLRLYFRLAWTNIKANYRLYVPYLLASTGMVMMFYIILMLAKDPSINMGYLSAVLSFGSMVVGLFAVAFILYINSFLMKQRTREFGLYNILGMEKPQIACIVLAEALLSYLIAMAGGIVLGTLFSKLVQLLLLRLIRFGGDIVMTLNASAALDTMLLFGIIYFLAFISTLNKVRKSRPVDMLTSASAGEQEPKAKWVMSIIGLLTLLAGYFLSQYVQSPVEAFLWFFIAVALVMVGTYCLFTTGSIAVLKLMQKNKQFYYKKNHFINVSGMMYRMQQNAKGLAQICILSCMVLVTISMTVSLYAGVEGMLKQRHGREMDITYYVSSSSQADSVRSEILSQAGNPIENELHYYSAKEQLQGDNGIYTWISDQSNGLDSWNTVLFIYSIDDYNTIADQNVTLQDNEILLYSSRDDNPDTLQIGTHSYQIKELLKSYPAELGSQLYSSESVRVLYAYCNNPFAMASEVEGTDSPVLAYTERFDTTLSDEDQSRLCNSFNTELFGGTELDGHAECIANDRTDFYQMTGSYLFIGIFLGGIFLIATVLIIYYKQVSEGYEDRHRYRILQQVGLSRQEVRKSINSQVLTVFFLPLVVALLHILFAFHMVYELMGAFGLSDSALFFKCMFLTAAVFALIYALVYWITSRVYYHIIEQPSAN